MLTMFGVISLLTKANNLLAVQEYEDSRARTNDWAPDAAVLDKCSKVKTSSSFEK